MYDDETPEEAVRNVRTLSIGRRCPVDALKELKESGGILYYPGA
jgi:hypothetical protein